MKRYLKMLMTLVALAALLVMTAAPTVAKKPDNPGSRSRVPGEESPVRERFSTPHGGIPLQM